MTGFDPAELTNLGLDQAITATNNEPIVDVEGKAATARWAPEFDDGTLRNAAALYRLTPAWKRADESAHLLDPGSVIRQNGQQRRS